MGRSLLQLEYFFSPSNSEKPATYYYILNEGFYAVGF